MGRCNWEYKIKYNKLNKSNDEIRTNIEELYSNYEIKLLKEDNILIKDYIEEVKIKLNDNKEYDTIKQDNIKLKEAIKVILDKINKK